MTNTDITHGWTTLIAQASDPASSLLMGGSNSQAGTPATGTATPAGTGTGNPTGPGGMGMIWVIGLGLITFMLIQTIFGQRREKKRREGLISSLRKHDWVVTIGGIIGTVVDVDEHEVVLKIDENANTRVRFTKPSIQAVLNSPSAAAEPAGSPKIEVKTGGSKATV